MKALRWFVCILSLSIAGVACNQTGEDTAFPGASGTSSATVDGGTQAAESLSEQDASRQVATELPPKKRRGL
jgi:hypothetical protein